MNKRDRNEAIFSCHKKGLPQTKIGEIFNLTQSAVSQILKALKGGPVPVPPETRGAKPRLSEGQKNGLSEILRQRPSEFGHTTWDKWSVRSTIQEKFGVTYHENYICEIMKSINFTSQKPSIKDYRQDPVEVAAFKADKAPAITNKAGGEGRRLAFQDECAVRLLPCVARTYAPRGERPELEADSKNKGYVSVAGCISPDGDAYFEVREGEGFKQKGLTRFLDNCWAAWLEKLLVVWDGAPSHNSQTVKDYLAGQDPGTPRIWLEKTPAYSPEFNPIEQVWAYLKGKLANHFFKTTRELRKAVTETLEQIKNDRELVKSFFRRKELECYQFSI